MLLNFWNILNFGPDSEICTHGDNLIMVMPLCGGRQYLIEIFEPYEEEDIDGYFSCWYKEVTSEVDSVGEAFKKATDHIENQ